MSLFNMLLSSTVPDGRVKLGKTGDKVLTAGYSKAGGLKANKHKY